MNYFYSICLLFSDPIKLTAKTSEFGFVGAAEEIEFRWLNGNYTNVTVKGPKNQSMYFIFVGNEAELTLTIDSDRKLGNYTWYINDDVLVTFTLLYRMCKHLLLLWVMDHLK